MKAILLRENIIAGDEYKYGLFSDLHIDSKDFNKKQFIKDMDWCKENNVKIMFNGDVFDLILARDMKRATASRLEATDGQINVKMNKVANLLKPYVDNIVFIGRGNHEESCTKFNGIDMTAWLVHELNHYKTNGVIALGGYKNFIRIGFLYENQKAKNFRITYDIMAHHGGGANAPVTKGMIDFNRIVQNHSADLYWTGHKHQNIQDASIPLMEISSSNNVIIKNRQAIQTPSYCYQADFSDDLNYGDKFFGLQASPGFGLLTLIPRRTLKDIYLDIDVRFIKPNSVQSFDVMEKINETNKSKNR